MCADMFDVPVALVSLVDEKRQWFKAKHNFDPTQTGRAESFCAWTTLSIERKVLVVRDAEYDPKFKDNPLVVGEPGIRFYAGAPLVVDGCVLGSICLIDFQPHVAESFFDEPAARRLQSIAHTISSHLQKSTYGAWLGAAIDTVREGVLLLEHIASVPKLDDDGQHGEEFNADEKMAVDAVFDSVDEYIAAQMVRNNPSGGRDVPVRAPPHPSTERVVFANAAAKLMLSSRNSEKPSPTRRTSRFSRNLSEESFAPQIPQGVVGCDLAHAFPGPPETVAKLKWVSRILAEDAARRRSKRANALGDICDNTNALLESKARAESPSLGERRNSFQSMSFGEAPASEQEWETRWKNTARAGPVPTVEIDADFPDGRRRIELSFTNVPMDALGCPATLVHARDITKDFESKNALRRAKERSDAAVEAKSSFLANTSHEIRTPLNAIIAGSELLGDITEGLSGDQIELIDMVTRAGKSLLAIVNDVLDFSKIEADKLTLEHRPFVLENCMDLSFEMQAIKANAKALVLNYSIDDSVPWGLVGDEARLRQVVTNLISNAVKFTPKQGSVVLKVRALGDDEDVRDALRGAIDSGKRGRTSMEHATRDAAWLEDNSRFSKLNRGSNKLSDLSHEAYDVPLDMRAATFVDDADDNTVRLLFEVIDTGIGLSESDRASLFTAFEQVNNKRTRQEGGTGLGLVISMRLVRLMGGDMTVTSDGRGCGSRFAFCVRLQKPDEKNEKSKSGKKESFEGRRSVESQFAPISGVLRGRRVDVISTCESFRNSADSFILGLGLETNFLSPHEVAELVQRKERLPTLDDPVAILLDREFIPRAALGDAFFDMDMPMEMHDSDSKFLDACDEFIGNLSTELERTKRDSIPVSSTPPSVMVMTFHSTACDLSAMISICTKPLVHGKLQRWVAGLVTRHSEDTANHKANALWDAKHVRFNDAFVFQGFQKENSISELAAHSSSKIFDSAGTSARVNGSVGGLQRRGSLVNLAAIDAHDDSMEITDIDPEVKKRVRVLLAEDNKVNQKVATKILHSMGFLVTVASDGEKAVATFSEHANRGDSFDLVLMDLQMPLMDGMEAAQAIIASLGGKSGPPPRIVALTADVASSVIQECRDAGMHGFLGKPIDRLRLGRVMRDVTNWVRKGRPEVFEAEGTWEIS